MSESNIIQFNNIVSAEIPCEKVLQGAIAANLDAVLVIGWDENGEMYSASSMGDVGELLLLIEKYKKELLDV